MIDISDKWNKSTWLISIC